MKALKRFTNLVLALCVLASAQKVQATVLPVSTYATAQNNWQGSKYYSGAANDGSTINCRMDFAVYDTAGQTSTAENNFFNSVSSVMPDMSRYLYVYQVFNNLADSDASVAYFAIFNLSHTQLNVISQNIGAADDGAGGIEPSSSELKDNGTKAVWNFAGSLLLQDDHSWFLVLSSDSGPVTGGFEIKSSDADPGVPDGPIPEPATIALLSSGALMIAGRRKCK
jgi:hypothetical protein